MNKPTRNVDPGFRDKLLSRDGRCLVCGSVLDENTINPHHIETRGSGGDDSLENGISLCSWCHDDVHRGHVIISSIKFSVTAETLRWLLVLNYGYEYEPYELEGGQPVAEYLFQRYSFQREAWF